MRVLIFSPDRHIQYDGRTPDETGVGGGITARIRMAAALARLGHQVTCQVNCAQALVHDGVSYIPLAATAPAEVEVLMLNTTGGELDLSAAGELRTQAQLIIVRIGGKPQLNGLETTGYDWIYVVSNFLRGVVVNEWGIAANRVFTAYNGVEERIFRAEEQSNPSRDPFKIAYVGHPNKGLSAAVRVFELLRERDERYQLHLYGGHALWGQPQIDLRQDRPGIVDHGLIPQRTLAAELLATAYVVQLQAIEEGFGIAIAEILRAGCIVVASPVGAIPEIIHHETNGFLISGHHEDDEVHGKAASLIQQLQDDVAHTDTIRRRAKNFRWNWDLMARVWSGHWEWALSGAVAENEVATRAIHRCSTCEGISLVLVDGYHCLACGRYQPNAPEQELEP